MATYIIDRTDRHWQRPRWPYRIDHDQPIVRSLIGAWTNEGAGVLATPPQFARVNPPMVGNPTVASQPHFGPGLSFDGSDDEGTIAIPASDNQTDVSVAVWMSYIQASPEFGRVIEKGANDAWVLNINETAANSGLVSWQSRVGGNSRLTTSGIYTDGVHLFVGRARLNSGPMSLVVDGGIENLSTTTAATAGNYGTSSVFFGRYGGGGFRATFVLYAAFLWSRYLSDGEVYALYAPRTRWQMFQRSPRRMVFQVGEVGGGFVAFPHPRGMRGGMHWLSGGMQ